MTADEDILSFISKHPDSTVSEIAAGVPTVTKECIFRHVFSMTRYRMLSRKTRTGHGHKDYFEYRVVE